MYQDGTSLSSAGAGLSFGFALYMIFGAGAGTEGAVVADSLLAEDEESPLVYLYAELFTTHFG